MSGVLAGFFIVWSMIGVGWVVGRTGVLGAHGRYVLNRTTFFVASPALVLVGLLGWGDMGNRLWRGSRCRGRGGGGVTASKPVYGAAVRWPMACMRDAH